MLLVIPHVRPTDTVGVKTHHMVEMLKCESVELEVAIDDTYHDDVYVPTVKTGRWYVQALIKVHKKVMDQADTRINRIESACVYSSKDYENAYYVGRRLLEKFFATDNSTIDLGAMVKGILIEAHLADEPEPESTGGRDEEDTDGGETVSEDTVEKWARDDLPTDGNSTGNGEDLIKRYEFTFPEGQFTRCGTDTVVTFSNGRITERK